MDIGRKIADTECEIDRMIELGGVSEHYFRGFLDSLRIINFISEREQEEYVRAFLVRGHISPEEDQRRRDEERDEVMRARGLID